MLDPTAMKDLIKTKLQALSDFPTSGQSPVIIDDRALQALCEGIIEHIVAETLVTIDMWDSYVPGITPGGGTSGIMVGTATGGVS